MKKLIVVLGGLLALQLVLAVAMNLSSDDYGAFKPQQKLLAFDRKAVDGLRIEDDKNSVVLSKRDGKWVLPQNADFPANTASVERLLDTLAGLDKGWPVATTSAAARRFKVADDKFERKLSLLSNGKPLAVLYVGTSPGYRKVNVRPANQDAVFTVALNTWEASTKVDNWLDKAILAIAPDDVTRLDMPGFVLQRDNDKLSVAGLTGEQETNAKAAATLLDKLAGLQIQSLLGVKDKPEYQQDKPELEFKVTRKNGDVLSYRISRPKDGDYYVLKRSDLDDYFKLADYEVKPLKEAAREKLVQNLSEKKPAQAAAGDSAPASTTPTSMAKTAGMSK
jgi:hypothetical protein